MSAGRYLKELRKGLLRISVIALRYLNLAAIGVLVFDLGFYHSDLQLTFIEYFYIAFLSVASVALLFRASLARKVRGRTVAVDVAAFALVVTVFCIRYISTDWVAQYLPWLLFFGSDWVLHLVVVLLLLIQVSRSDIRLASLSANPALLFIMSFVLLVVAGASLLLLPRSTVSGIRIVDAFFTSTSAVCVTGLTVIDTATQFTFFGKCIILLLIQLGGFGIMTFTTFFAFVFRGSSSVRDQLYLKDYMQVEQLSEVMSTLLKIVLITLLFEAAGAIAIWFSLDDTLVTGVEKIWFSVFHSVSAFCNAGFSTLSNGLYDEGLRFNYSLQIVISFLIIMGGLCFPIVFNFTQWIKQRTRKLSSRILFNRPAAHVPRIININTKLVIITTTVLLCVGWLLFFLTEHNNVLEDHPWYGQVIVSFFGSVTPRTAGFNAWDMSALTTSTVLLYLLLMWIGASPGSTGGGIKTTTFAIAMMNVVSLARGKDRIEMERREVSGESVKRAFAVMALSLLVIGLSVFLVTMFDPTKELLAVAFECFSAFATVGLTLNLTPQLSDASKVVVMLTMFIGRVGTITLIVAFIRKASTLNYRYPKENIFIN